MRGSDPQSAPQFASTRQVRLIGSCCRPSLRGPALPAESQSNGSGHLGWIREYSKSLYLRKLPDDALKRRYEDLAGNLWSTDAAGNVVPIRNPQQRQQLVELIVHVLCEQRLRAGDPSLAFNEGEIRRAASAGYQPPKLTKPFVGPTSGFAKFGKQIHTRTAFEEGVLRVAPASGFNDPSLNSAQRDDELQHWDVTPNKQLLMRFLRPGRSRNLRRQERDAPWRDCPGLLCLVLRRWI